MQRKLDLYPRAYASRDGFRPVIRTYRDGKPHGSKSSPHRFPTIEAALHYAKTAALSVAIRHSSLECVIRVH